MYKIRPFLEYLQENFENENYPSHNLSMDECMVSFKGRLGIKQYIKDKPNKWGIKVFLCCDSLTVYCFRFDIYKGRIYLVNLKRKMWTSLQQLFFHKRNGVKESHSLCG